MFFTTDASAHQRHHLPLIALKIIIAPLKQMESSLFVTCWKL